MADKARRNKTTPLNVFFLNGKLHKKLRIVRPADTIETWCYPEHRRVAYTYSDVRKNYKPAFSTKQVADMLGKSVMTLENVLKAGGIEEPATMYSLTENKHKFARRWSEEDIMNLHAYMLSVHRGRPRNDGRITPQQMPTASELRAMIRQEQILYVKTEDGNFRPAWRAQDFT